VCARQGGCTLVLEKVSTKGTRREQDQCNYASRIVEEIGNSMVDF
jgi:hypothetical protein